MKFNFLNKINARRGWPGDKLRNPSVFYKDYLFRYSLSKLLRSSIDNELSKHGLIVLDIGCGNKPYYPFFKDIASEYLGCDIEKNHLVDIICPAEMLSLKDKSIDVIVCTQVLEHCKYPIRVIKEISRVLKGEGIAFVSTHGNFHFHPFPHDYWRWTQEGLEQLFSIFRSVKIIHQGGSALCLSFYIARGIYEISNWHFIFKPLRFTLYPLINFFGLLLDKLIPDKSFPINYLVIAKR